ncbi:MAG: hypothetical protein NTW96_09955 [Planctomycetia bacterium]|nr:hypothetical protein [Planctomycetia bacterium]
MAEPSPDHWNAIIAAGSVLSGVIVSQATSMFAAWLDRRRRKKGTLLAKLDEMMIALEQARNWWVRISQATTIRDLQASPLTECGRLQTLPILYFRHLETPVADYVNSLRTYYLWAIACLSRLGPNSELPIPLDTWLRMSDEHSEQTKQHCTTMLECQQRLILAMKATAHELLTNS